MFTAQELKSLNELEMLVYQYVTEHRSAVPYMRIRELATEAHVSTTTVLHFCKKMGCEGFSQFKWKLKEENGIDTQDKDIPDALNELQTFFWRVGTPAYREKLEQEMQALESIGAKAEFAENLPLPFPTVGAVKFPHQAQFHPLKFLSAIADELTIYENTPVRRLEKGAAVTDRGVIRADAFIVATHFPFLNKHGSYFLKLYQQRSYVLALENAPALRGMYLDERENGLSFREYDGRLILGGGGHRTGHEGGGWNALEQFAKTHYPDARITHRWAAQDCMSLDGVPYIGRYSAMTPNLYVASGFNKWGMTTSMVAAQLLTDIITGKKSPYEAVFSPSRSMLHAQLGVNAVEAGKNLLTVSPRRCSHLGCALKWNSQERSWDCPCHGSRFEENGRLIDNPATKNLRSH